MTSSIATGTADCFDYGTKKRGFRGSLSFLCGLGGLAVSVYPQVRRQGGGCPRPSASRGGWVCCSLPIVSWGFTAALRRRLCGRGSGYAGRDGRKSPVVRTSAKAPCRAAMNASCTVAAGMVFPFHDRSRVAQASFACAFSATTPLRLKRRHNMGEDVEVWSCSGTPVDCVKLALDQF